MADWNLKWGAIEEAVWYDKTITLTGKTMAAESSTEKTLPADGSTEKTLSASAFTEKVLNG